MPTIVHFDISADDVLRAKKFYEDLFGWKINKFPNALDDYYLIETTQDDGEPGIYGSIAKRVNPLHEITNFIGVDDIDEVMKQVVAFGGKVKSTKNEIPEIGYMVVCEDTEGNVFGLFQKE